VRSLDRLQPDSGEGDGPRIGDEGAVVRGERIIDGCVRAGIGDGDRLTERVSTANRREDRVSTCDQSAVDGDVLLAKLASPGNWAIT